MLHYPNIDPVAFHIGPLPVHWYGLMYAIGFISAWGLALWRARRPQSGWNAEQVSDLIFYCALGVIIGGRLGYVFFYGWQNFMADPWSVVKVWQGGMSFHGGLIGVSLALWLYGRKLGKSFLTMTDFVVPLVPIGLGAGRIGNFINGELWGRVTTVPWGMVFPQAGLEPRHPSQLYEFLLEGVLLFIILWWYSAKPKPKGAVSALFLIGYGSFRFLVEFFRQPDPQLNFIAFGWLTRGQELSLPMILAGVLMMIWAYRSAKRMQA